MTPNKLIWKELWQRPTAMVTCLTAIVLGVAALVAIRSVTLFSERAVSKQLETLGANVLLLPQSVSLHDYYTADAHGATLPEEHATRLAMGNLEGVEHIAPKLCVPIEMNERRLTLTGILPQSEFQDKAAWQSFQVFNNKHANCKRSTVMDNDTRTASESLAKSRFVREIAADEVILGSEVPEMLGADASKSITLLGQEFRVAGVMPPTGTVDDGRVFAHLHTVQRLSNAGETVNVIEVMACCEDAAGGLLGKLADMFPDVKIVTINQVVDTQVTVNRLLTRVSYVFLVVLVVAGAGSIAGAMFANVSERRKEIGTLVALGASPALVSRLFLGKALVVGLAGGVLGYVGGTLLAVVVGPQWAGIAVAPVPSLAVTSLLLAAVVTVVASYLPARRAALMDPCQCFREE